MATTQKAAKMPSRSLKSVPQLYKPQQIPTIVEEEEHESDENAAPYSPSSLSNDDESISSASSMTLSTTTTASSKKRPRHNIQQTKHHSSKTHRDDDIENRDVSKASAVTVVTTETDNGDDDDGNLELLTPAAKRKSRSFLTSSQAASAILSQISHSSSNNTSLMEDDECSISKQCGGDDDESSHSSASTPTPSLLLSSMPFFDRIHEHQPQPQSYGNSSISESSSVSSSSSSFTTSTADHALKKKKQEFLKINWSIHLAHLNLQTVEWLHNPGIQRLLGDELWAIACEATFMQRIRGFSLQDGGRNGKEFRCESRISLRPSKSLSSTTDNGNNDDDHDDPTDVYHTIHVAMSKKMIKILGCTCNGSHNVPSSLTQLHSLLSSELGGKGRPIPKSTQIKIQNEGRPPKIFCVHFAALIFVANLFRHYTYKPYKPFVLNRSDYERSGSVVCNNPGDDGIHEASSAATTTESMTSSQNNEMLERLDELGVFLPWLVRMHIHLQSSQHFSVPHFVHDAHSIQSMENDLKMMPPTTKLKIPRVKRGPNKKKGIITTAGAAIEGTNTATSFEPLNDVVIDLDGESENTLSTHPHQKQHQQVRQTKTVSSSSGVRQQQKRPTSSIHPVHRQQNHPPQQAQVPTGGKSVGRREEFNRRSVGQNGSSSKSSSSSSGHAPLSLLPPPPAVRTMNSQRQVGISALKKRLILSSVASSHIESGHFGKWAMLSFSPSLIAQVLGSDAEAMIERFAAQISSDELLGFCNREINNPDMSNDGRNLVGAHFNSHHQYRQPSQLQQQGLYSHHHTPSTPNQSFFNDQYHHQSSYSSHHDDPHPHYLHHQQHQYSEPSSVVDTSLLLHLEEQSMNEQHLEEIPSLLPIEKEPMRKEAATTVVAVTNDNGAEEVENQEEEEEEDADIETISTAATQFGDDDDDFDERREGDYDDTFSVAATEGDFDDDAFSIAATELEFGDQNLDEDGENRYYINYKHHEFALLHGAEEDTYFDEAPSTKL